MNYLKEKGIKVKITLKWEDIFGKRGCHMGIWSKFIAWFNPLLKKFRTFLGAVFQGALEIAMATIQEIANEVVAEIAADPSLITDSDKRKAAFDRIKVRVEDMGEDAKDSLINLAIELAVQYLKNK